MISMIAQVATAITLLVGSVDINEYGFDWGNNDQTYRESVTFEVEGTESGVGYELSVQGYDSDTNNEIRVLIDGTDRGFLSQSLNNAVGPVNVFAFDGTGNPVTIVFEQARTLGWKWGVTNVAVQVNELNDIDTDPDGDGHDDTEGSDTGSDQVVTNVDLETIIAAYEEQLEAILAAPAPTVEELAAANREALRFHKRMIDRLAQAIVTVRARLSFAGQSPVTFHLDRYVRGLTPEQRASLLAELEELIDQATTPDP